MYDEIYDDYDQFCCVDCALFSSFKGKKGQCDHTGRTVSAGQEACPNFLPDGM